MGIHGFEIVNIVATHVLDYVDVIGGWQAHTISVGPYDDLLILSRDPPYRFGSDSARRYKGSYQYRLHHLQKDQTIVINLPSTKSTYRTAQPFLNKGYLLQRLDMAGQILLLDIQGRVSTKWDVGDIASYMWVTPNGTTWFGFGDESYFNSRLDNPGVLANEGIIALSSSGAVLYKHFLSKNSTPENWSFVDCYGMNAVSDTEVWLAPFESKWNLYHVVDFEIVESWLDYGVSLVKDFAIHPPHSLFAKRPRPGTDKPLNRQHILYLLDLETLEITEGRAVDSAGMRIEVKSQFARESKLHLSTDKSLYIIDIAAELEIL